MNYNWNTNYTWNVLVYNWFKCANEIDQVCKFCKCCSQRKCWKVNFDMKCTKCPHSGPPREFKDSGVKERQGPLWATLEELFQGLEFNHGILLLVYFMRPPRPTPISTVLSTLAFFHISTYNFLTVTLISAVFSLVSICGCSRMTVILHPQLILATFLCTERQFYSVWQPHFRMTIATNLRWIPQFN